MDCIFGGIGLLIAPSVPQYRRAPRLNTLVHDAYTRGCRKPAAKWLSSCMSLQVTLML